MSRPRRFVIGHPLLGLLLAALLVDRSHAQQPPQEDLFGEAKTLSTQEHWSESIERFRQFLRQAPDDPRTSEARFWIGYALVKEGEFDDAAGTLEPFENALAGDKWADDSLLQLGHAYRGQDRTDRALDAWKRLLEKYPSSPWRIEAAAQIVDVLFHEKRDYAACLPYCERVVAETTDRSGISEVRYAGAYCLVALGRDNDADLWMERWFDPASALETGWKRVLRALRDLRRGESAPAIAALTAIDTDFPDLDRDDRLELLLQAASMLSREKQAGRARSLLITRIKESVGDSEDELDALLDALAETEDQEQVPVTLEQLARQPLPITARVAILGRRVELLRDHQKTGEAETLLRAALASEKIEFARFRAGLLLADILDEDRENRTAAASLLKRLLAELTRADLVHQVRDRLAELEPDGKPER